MRRILRSRSPIKSNESSMSSNNESRQLRRRKVPSRLSFNEDPPQCTYDTSEYEQLIRDRRFQHPDSVFQLDAKDFTLEYARRTGLKKVLLFTGQQNELGMKIPDFGYDELLSFIPRNQTAHVFNHARDEQKIMQVSSVINELKKPIGSNRRGPYNMLSFECSFCELGNYIQIPQIVRQMDWAQTVFPKEQFLSRGFSYLEKYVMMSMAGSFTNFHVELSGTSTWYHVQRGYQYFFLIKPTDANIEQLGQWTTSNFVGTKTVFFGNLVPKCSCVRVDAGQTIFVPSGYIHAVYMPVDSVVFAGNFLHEYSIDIQFKICHFENRIEAKEEFVYQFYVQTLWYYIADVVRRATNREYVRLIHSAEVKREFNEQEQNCFDIIVRPSDFYNLNEGSPTQTLFDSIDESQNDPPAEFCDDYLKIIKPELRFYWKKQILPFLDSKLSDLSQALVAEGIRRPRHLFNDFKCVMGRCLQLNYIAAPFNAENNSEIKQEVETNGSMVFGSDQVSSNKHLIASTSGTQKQLVNSDLDLRWKLWQAKEDEGFYDYILKSNGHDFKINKCVLMCQSTFFKEVIPAYPKKNSWVLEKFELDVVDSFVRWLYLGSESRLNVNEEKLFELADKYGVDQLKKHCIESFGLTLNQTNMYSRFIFAFQHNEETLKQSIADFAKRKKISNFVFLSTLVRSAEFASLTATDNEKCGQMTDFIGKSL